MSEWVVVDRRLLLTEDGRRVVEEGDPEGRWLHWTPGTRVLKSEYDRLAKKPVETVELPKQAPTPKNKSRRPSSNK